MEQKKQSVFQSTNLNLEFVVVLCRDGLPVPISATATKDEIRNGLEFSQN